MYNARISMITRNFSAFLICSSILFVTACSSDSSNRDQAFGGTWAGTDGNGDQVLALSTEIGQLRWFVPATGEQGVGWGTVQRREVFLDFRTVMPLGFTLPDGSTHANCTGIGPIGERESMSATVDCLSSNDLVFQNTISLTYDPLYEEPSSLSTIAGDYDDFGQVISVSNDGTIFKQDANTGCTINGEASIIDERYNTYRVEWSYSNCQGADAVLNGSTFSGMGTYDNTAATHQLIVALTGVVNGVTYSLVATLPKL